MGNQGGGSKENIIWEQGSQKLQKGAGSHQKLPNGLTSGRSQRNYLGARGKSKIKQGAKRYEQEKGVVKIGKKEQA